MFGSIMYIKKSFRKFQPMISYSLVRSQHANSNATSINQLQWQHPSPQPSVSSVHANIVLTDSAATVYSPRSREGIIARGQRTVDVLRTLFVRDKLSLDALMTLDHKKTQRVAALLRVCDSPNPPKGSMIKNILQTNLRLEQLRAPIVVERQGPRLAVEMLEPTVTEERRLLMLPRAELIAKAKRAGVKADVTSAQLVKELISDPSKVDSDYCVTQVEPKINSERSIVAAEPINDELSKASKRAIRRLAVTLGLKTGIIKRDVLESRLRKVLGENYPNSIESTQPDYSAISVNDLSRWAKRLKEPVEFRSLTMPEIKALARVSNLKRARLSRYQLVQQILKHREGKTCAADYDVKPAWGERAGYSVPAIKIYSRASEPLLQGHETAFLSLNKLRMLARSAVTKRAHAQLTSTLTEANSNNVDNAPDSNSIDKLLTIEKKILSLIGEAPTKINDGLGPIDSRPRSKLSRRRLLKLLRDYTNSGGILDWSLCPTPCMNSSKIGNVNQISTPQPSPDAIEYSKEMVKLRKLKRKVLKQVASSVGLKIGALSRSILEERLCRLQRGEAPNPAHLVIWARRAREPIDLRSLTMRQMQQLAHSMQLKTACISRINLVQRIVRHREGRGVDEDYKDGAPYRRRHEPLLQGRSTAEVTFRQLQCLAKSAGLRAKDTRPVLLARLHQHASVGGELCWHVIQPRDKGNPVADSCILERNVETVDP